MLFNYNINYFQNNVGEMKDIYGKLESKKTKTKKTILGRVGVDSSDYMRNGDFLPTRLHAQQDAVNLVCHSKTRSNPENNVGLITLSRNTEVLVTLTSDVAKLLAKLHQLRPKGDINFVSGIRVAHLVLKHRQGKNHKMRIIAFVGSPIEDSDKELVKLGKKLRKEKVNVDIINFGEESLNTEKLTAFINAINGSDGSSSHLVTVPSGPLLSDALLSSPVIVGEDGAGGIAGGYEFGVDPNEDPELALALRVSMEEQRAHQEEEARRAARNAAKTVVSTIQEETSDELLLKQALEMSMQTDADKTDSKPEDHPTSKNISDMTEDEQMAFALQMSMEVQKPDVTEEVKMEEDDMTEVLNDTDFLRSVLEGLPGVDPQSDAVKEAVNQLNKNNDPEKKNPKKKEDK